MIIQYKNNLTIKISWLNHLSNRWNIAQKIGYGYAVAISISFIGTISGLLLAHNNEVDAYNQFSLSYQQQSLLKDLENSVTRIRLHPQRLGTLVGNSEALEIEKNLFKDQLITVNEHLNKIKKFTESHGNDLIMSKKNFDAFLNNYFLTTQLYTKTVVSFWQHLEQKKISGEEFNYTDLIVLLQKQQEVNINVKFDQLSYQLTQIIDYADIQKQKAVTRYEKAEKLRILVILASMLLSVGIAAALALYTSKLIARPLRLVTDVARRITQESNFQLRANIDSNDEVGTLATSLNQLVDWVEDYTKELELARDNLEQRVEERTQELELERQNLEQRVEERTQELQKILQDLTATQTQLIQSEKMSSLGEMVAGIAHEVNNPVNFIYGNVEYANEYIKDLLSLIDLYQQEYPESNLKIADRIAEIDLDYIAKDILRVLSSMKMGAERIRQIVLSLRNFSRLDEADKKEVNIHEGIDNSLFILNHKISKEITIIKNYGNLPEIECYPAQLNQVFMNILNNAIDAVVEAENQPDKHINIDTFKLDDHLIKVVIRDNGSGITPEIINKLFNPFFTTKPVGKGTGLGLSISYKIIEKHKGKIEVRSELGKGTEFIIILPIKTD